MEVEEEEGEGQVVRYLGEKQFRRWSNNISILVDTTLFSIYGILNSLVSFHSLFHTHISPLSLSLSLSL